ncbi:MAG: peptidylprolyl isomerase [Gammaproteobacteria bacterium]
MRRYLLSLILVIPAFVLSGCKPGDSPGPGNSGSDSAAIVEEGEVVARVNGQPITEETLQLVSEANRRANIPRDKLIDELIKYELLYQEAVSKNLENNPKTAQQLQFMRRSILSQAAMQDFMANTEISDAEVQKEYEQSYGSSGQEEYRARHILTKTEDKAKEVIQKLKEGGNFEALATEYSTGPTGPKGGDLGWFSAQQMVAPFSEAVVALKNGEYTQTPVQTQFGWHVILREDSRPKVPPSLDSLKANIRSQLQRKAIEKHLETLRAAAKIELTPPKPAEPAQPAASEPSAPAQPASEEKPAAQATDQAAPADPAGAEKAADSSTKTTTSESAPNEAAAPQSE